MGLPIFFEPSVPESPSKEAEKSTSRARSAIRRHPLRGNQPRPGHYARRRRAYLDNYERDTNSLELFQHLYQQQSIRPSARVSITTSTRDAMREAMRERSLAVVAPSISFERQSSRDAEADGPLMPAVPESRDYPNPPIGDVQGPPRILRTSVISISPYPETSTHSASRPSGDLSTSEVDDRSMDPNTVLAESVDGTDAQASLSRRDHLGRHARQLVRERFREREEQRRLARVQEESEREREGRQRGLNVRRQEQSILDDEMREERRVELRLDDRRLDESRDRQRIHNREVHRLNEFREQLRVDRLRLQGDIERLRNERDRLQSGREQIEENSSSNSERRQQADTSLAGREQVERSDAPSTGERERLLEQLEVGAYGREDMQSDVQSGLEEADSFIININYDGLGDREHSHDEFQEPEPAYRDFGGLQVVDNVEQLERLDAEGHGSWDGLLITPDPQSPNPSSSFASTAASSSQRPSMSTSISSLHETQPLTNGDCDTALDSETEDEQSQRGLEWFIRHRANRSHGRRL